MRIGFIAVIVAVCALALSAVLMQQRVASADGHSCPSSWPSESYEGRYTDDQGEGWFLIRSTDSNGFTTIRAYMADDNHSSGYAPGSPDEICILLVRRSGDSEDADQPERLVFSQEREEPSQTPATGGPSTGGGSQGNNADVIAILAAALEITRHSSALVAADLPASPQEVLQYRRMVTARENAMNAQLDDLAGSGQDARVAQIRTLVNGLVSNAKAILAGRPELLEAVRTEAMARERQARINQTVLLPGVTESVDNRFYEVITSVNGSAGSGNLSGADLLRYSHLQNLSSGVSLGQTFLVVASLMQDPTFVARIRESYDSVANRIDRDIKYLRGASDTQLEQLVLRQAQAALDAGTGANNYFDRLEDRLVLVAAENARVQSNERNAALLRDEIGRLAADVLGRQHPAPEAMPEPVVDNPGVTDTAIEFGQSADFSGGSMELGTGMRLGILAAFSEAGTVNGRTLTLTHKDDGYEPDRAFANTMQLIHQDQVFALIGAVGTPTSRAVSPLAHSEGVPFIAPFTGAALLRESDLANVLNLRASYHQETRRMVDYLVGQGITDVAVLYQNDSYGVDGLTGVEQALDVHGLEPAESWYYQRNTASVKSAVFRIAEADPGAVIIIGASEPAAQAIEMLREKLGADTVFMNVSFVGSDALAAELGAAGEGVFMTQVVPLPTDTSNPLVARYRQALLAEDPQAQPGFVSLEGYLAGRLAIYAVDACGQNVTRQCFLSAVQNAGTIDLNGFSLTFGPTDNQGSDEVILTMIDSEGEYVSVE